MMNSTLVERITNAVSRERLLETATRLIAVPSPTGSAGEVANTLADILKGDGFTVQREIADHPNAPAVLTRLNTGKPGRTLQFNGHLDVVHLPFVPPSVDGDRLLGSGSCDMKAGVAASYEAVRALRDVNALSSGSVLFSANDLHEAPWGFAQQLNALIRAGIHGDAVLIPESIRTHLPIAGRGSATWKVRVRRNGPPIHEVYRPDEPSVIAAGAELVRRLGELNQRLSKSIDPIAGSESVFIGQIHSGEIFNQYPQECWLEGTRRWLHTTESGYPEREFRELIAGVERDFGVTIPCDFQYIREAFRLDLSHPLINAFQASHANLSGAPLPEGPKMFVDDGNSFWKLADVPAITHGPIAGGAHTVNEWVSIDDLVRVAKLYALTAVMYLQA